MNIVFMGTPDFAVPALERMIAAGFVPQVVVTRPDLPRGRGQKVGITPVKAVALAHHIPVLQPESVKAPSFIEALRQYEIDVMVVVAYRILPPEVYHQAKLGAFNLHGSLLPRYRGAAPIHRAVMAGDAETGVTTFFLRDKVDTGDMILFKRTPIGPNETTGDVHDRMMLLGAEAVVETLERIAQGHVPSIPQDETLASPAPKIFMEDCAICWDADAQTVHNQIRGLSPFPGAWTKWNGKLLKVYRSEVVDGSGVPGTVLHNQKNLHIACGSGAVALREVQLEGRKRLTTEAFLSGAKPEIGTRLGD